ncbi:hypothetical protein OG552_14685 [Streptomyces sp. NBC_01476]|uniref:hypothetical protein n=1 Tax=Streptomyces sp. NBC_01476 TaxID=2903881 RepID=UPI002E351BFA|nr:hypothetical protein [Streptomyces sp. NBC_01476]
MGVESDQLVLDYLSRIGDLAQTTLPAAQRMQLVAQLRKDIDRERRGSDSPATVRRILDRLGPPDEVVEAAAGTVAGGRSRPTIPEPAAEPPPGSYGPYAKPRPKTQQDGDTDWWRMGPGEAGPIRAGDELAGLPGMTGGVFIPFDDEELAEDGPQVTRKRLVPVAEEEPAAEAVAEGPAAGPGGRRLLPRLGGLRSGGRGWGSPVLLLAAALLVAGAVIGSLIPMGLGWLMGYLSRRLTRRQAKFGILGIPGAAAAGLLVWLWGRDVGKWSTPIAEGHLGDAIQDALPATIRIAAVGSALYLLWRSRRPA